MLADRAKTLATAAAVAAFLLLLVLYFTAGSAGGSTPEVEPAAWYDLSQYEAYWHSEKHWSPLPKLSPMPLHEALLLVK